MVTTEDRAPGDRTIAAEVEVEDEGEVVVVAEETSRAPLATKKPKTPENARKRIKVLGQIITAVTNALEKWAEGGFQADGMFGSK